MSGIDKITVGDPLPTIASLGLTDAPLALNVTWNTGARAGRTDVVDLAPQILTFKVYRPLRDDPKLFDRAMVNDDGSAIVWPGNDDLEVSADAVEELAAQAMTSADFAAFIKDQGWTLDAAAAQLGIARRLVAYYAKDRVVPRYIALACETLRRSPHADNVNPPLTNSELASMRPAREVLPPEFFAKVKRAQKKRAAERT